MKKIMVLLLVMLVGCKSSSVDEMPNKSSKIVETENKNLDDEIVQLHPLDVINTHSDSYKVIKQGDKISVDFYFDVVNQYKQLKQKANLIKKYKIIVELKTDEVDALNVIEPINSELIYDNDSNRFILKDKIKTSVQRAVFDKQDMILKIHFLDNENIAIHQNSVHLKIVEKLEEK